MSKAILGDKKPLTTRPSAALPPADFAAVKADLQGGRCGEVLGEVTDELVVSSLLYPKVNTAVRVFVVVINVNIHFRRFEPRLMTLIFQDGKGSGVYDLALVSPGGELCVICMIYTAQIDAYHDGGGIQHDLAKPFLKGTEEPLNIVCPIFG